MKIPSTGFTIIVTRQRVESRGSGSGRRYRTVGKYKCYLDGKEIKDANMSGASVEPRGPGDNSKNGVNKSRRIESGTYQLGTHGFKGSKYHTFSYKKNKKPRPGIYVRDTNKRTAILIHKGVGFKSSVGCINLTGSILNSSDDIGTNTSFKHLDVLIRYMKNNVDFPSTAGKPIKNAWLIIEGEP